MVCSNSYYMLVASLPAMPSDFTVEQVPISQARLDKRLLMLQPGDAKVVEQLQAFLIWDRQPWDRTDEEMIARYKDLMSTTKNRLARHIVNFRMDVRTIMSGLRRRRSNSPPPPGVGRLVDHIRQNWEHPEFKLQWQHPWIVEMRQLLETTDCLGVQRLKLSAVWNHWKKLAEQHYFSFEAVLLYVARWEIINRWTSQNATLGLQRFEQLVTESLNEYASLYE